MMAAIGADELRHSPAARDTEIILTSNSHYRRVKYYNCLRLCREIDK
jgi:hypothetical protein